MRKTNNRTPIRAESYDRKTQKECAKLSRNFLVLSFSSLPSAAGIAAGWILAMVIASGDCGLQSPDDLCDGPAMAAGAIVVLSIPASFVAGVVLGILQYINIVIEATGFAVTVANGDKY